MVAILPLNTNTPTMPITQPMMQTTTPAQAASKNITQDQDQKSLPNTMQTSTQTTLQAVQNPAQMPVSPNNPCPFLRMLVANGELPNGESAIEKVNQAIDKMVAVRDMPQPMPAGFDMGIKSVASTANGLSPRQVAHNIRHGVRLDNLRYHIFDKRGSGSRLLDEQANFVPSELARLATFGSPKLDSEGNSEIGLNEKEIKAMMDANFARAKGHRRAIDRPVMNGEFPILLKVIGKQGKTERYLAVDDVERLFKERRLPERMEARLGKV